MKKILSAFLISFLIIIEALAADLKNISTRGFVGPGEQNMHAGFVVEGEGTVQVLIKAGGPSLPPDLNGLPDPNLRLFNAANGNQLHQNDNWQSDPCSNLVSATGLAPTHSQEPAFVRDLSAGSYTAVINGVNNTSGTALPSVTKVDVTGPCNGGGGNNNKQQTERLIGGWQLEVQDGNEVFVFTYALASPAFEFSNSPDVWFVDGKNTFSNSDVFAYFEPLDNLFYLINPVPNTTTDIVFTFNMSGDDNNVSGCQFFGENGQIVSDCFFMTGFRTFTSNSNSLQDSEQEIMQKYESMKQERRKETNIYYRTEDSM